MHEANIYNIYISGGVSAQTIESQIASSPLGIHGISVMLGYFGIIMYGISRLIKDNRAIVFIKHEKLPSAIGAFCEAEV